MKRKKKSAERKKEDLPETPTSPDVVDETIDESIADPDSPKSEVDAAADGKDHAADASADQPPDAQPDGEENIDRQVAVLQDRLLRLQADFDNFRKRSLRERQDVSRRATEDVLGSILPVLDHLDLAMQAAESHNADQQLVAGFRLVSDELIGILTKSGLEAIDAEGQSFDHNFHEAISRAPSEEHSEGVVVMQVRRGYKIGDRLLRAAQVIVSSGTPGETTAVADAESPEKSKKE